MCLPKHTYCRWCHGKHTQWGKKRAIKLVRSFFFVCATEKLAFYLWQREKSSFSYYMCSTGWLFLTPHSPAVVSTGLVSYVLSICFIIILIQLALLCAVHLPQLAHRSCVNPLPFPFAPSRPISLSLSNSHSIFSVTIWSRLAASCYIDSGKKSPHMLRDHRKSS